MVHCGIWDWWIVGFVQHVYSFLVRWCDSFTDVSSALLHWYLAIVWLLYKQTRRVWVKLFSAWTKPITANRQTLRAHVKIISGTQCTCASYSWDTLYMYELFLRYTVYVQVIHEIHCTCTSYSWDTVYMYKLFLGYSFLHVQVIHGTQCTCTQCTCTSYSWDTVYMYNLFLGYSVHVQVIPEIHCTCTSSICVGEFVCIFQIVYQI